MSGIRLSEKHGVNPSVSLCMICGEAKEVVLFGKLQGDKEAPREVCRDMEPCNACQEKMKEYVVLMEVEGGKGSAVTDRRVWVLRTAIPRLFQPAEVAQNLLDHGLGYISREGCEKLAEMFREADKAPAEEPSK